MNHPKTESDPRWAALQSRDPSADGKFWYSVATTGVYCRPTCKSRLPRPENVRFYTSTEAAERAGFRPCKRCGTASNRAQKIADACRAIESSDAAPSLADLAKNASLSPYHFHRLFKQATGVTPKQYATAHRASKLRTQLTQGATITDAIYNSGYNSNSRFYADSNNLLGMTPSTYRSGGPSAEIRFAIGESSLGSILVARSQRGICAILLGDDPAALARDLQDRFPEATLIGADRDFEQLVARVVGFVEAPAVGLDLPLDVRGTAFQQRVWQALRKIPAGASATYSEIAARIGSPKSVRAVAQACAANTLAVAIPCHRVIRSDGALSGYRWGVERKQILLDRERPQ